jgi:hypothetical protein
MQLGRQNYRSPYLCNEVSSVHYELQCKRGKRTHELFGAMLGQVQ